MASKVEELWAQLRKDAMFKELNEHLCTPKPISKVPGRSPVVPPVQPIKQIHVQDLNTEEADAKT